MDFAKRRRYDSTLEFDDSIPSAKDIKQEDDFYTLFGKTFKNNAKFAVEVPAPELGNKDTSMEDVRKFYAYWDHFKSWKEFAQFDEHDPTKAQSRYEKRWMEGENKKEREIHKKAENKRLIKLAETCYELDPRIQAIIKKEKDEKDAIKKGKQDIKMKQYREAEEKKKAEEDIKNKAGNAAADLAKQAKEEKKLKDQKYRASQKELTTVICAAMPGTNYDKFYVEVLVKRYTQQEAIDALIQSIKDIGTQPSVPEFVSKFLDIVESEADKKAR